MKKRFRDPHAWTGGCPWCCGPESKHGDCLSAECRENRSKGGGVAGKQAPSSDLPEPKGPAGYLRVPTSGKTYPCKSCGVRIGYTGRVPLDLSRSVKVGGYQFAPSHFATCPNAEAHRRVPA